MNTILLILAAIAAISSMFSFGVIVWHAFKEQPETVKAPRLPKNLRKRKDFILQQVLRDVVTYQQLYGPLTAEQRKKVLDEMEEKNHD